MRFQNTRLNDPKLSNAESIAKVQQRQRLGNLAMRFGLTACISTTPQYVRGD